MGEQFEVRKNEAENRDIYPWVVLDLEDFNHPKAVVFAVTPHTARQFCAQLNNVGHIEVS